MAGAAGRVPAGNQTDKVPCKIASVIQININGFPAWALIDSGADQSMVNENFASRAVGRDKLHQAHVERMTGAGGVPLTVCGQADISLEIKNTPFSQTILVVRDLVYQVVLGRYFCCRYGTVLDDKTLKSVCLPMPKSGQDGPEY